MNLAVVAFDQHGNVRELDLNVTVSAASGSADQQAPVVNSLTASGDLKAGNSSPTATLRAKASERPSHSAGAVTFISFFRQHSNAGQYFVRVNVALLLLRTCWRLFRGYG
jgi:transcriptional regulator with AAA-type ATPase domain